MENIRLKILAGFKAGESASHLSKIYALSLEQVLEWKRLTTCGHTDWVDGTRREYGIEEKQLILGKNVPVFGYKQLTASRPRPVIISAVTKMTNQRIKSES